VTVQLRPRPIEAVVRERVVEFMKERHVRGSNYRVEFENTRSMPNDECQELVRELVGNPHYEYTGMPDPAQLQFMRDLERLVFECIGRSGVRVQLQEK
jgi:hypothetical protein